MKLTKLTFTLLVSIVFFNNDCIYAKGIQIIKADHKVLSLTIYKDASLVEREATIKLNAGINYVHFDGLSAFYDDNHEVIELSSSEVNLLSRSLVEGETLYELLNSDLRLQVDQLSQLNEEISTLQYKISLINTRNKILEENAVRPSESFEALNDFLDMSQEEQLQLRKRLQHLQEELRITETRRNQAVMALPFPIGYTKQKNKSLILKLHCNEPLETKISLKYGDKGLRWSSSNRLEISSQGAAKLTNKGAISLVGLTENMSLNALVLSDFNLKQSLFRGQLSPIYIGDKKQRVNEKRLQASVFDDYNWGEEKSEDNQDFGINFSDGFESSSSILAKNYHFNRPINLEVGKEIPEFHLDSIAIENFELEKVLYPSLNTNAMVIGRLPIKLAQFFPSGGATQVLYDQQVFTVYHHQLITELEKSTIEIPLATDQRIISKRDRVINKRSSRRGQITEKVGFNIYLNTSSPNQERIAVHDRIPISTHDDVTVSIVKLDGGKFDPETGIVIWNLNLKEQKTIYFEYELKYPEDTIIPEL
ncbi:MAG: DUF4139 domain-containing protein [Cyclobacteriaceae bacterium]|nr:DUF4139 domain-containing protein [Cyclobacteriaceae bacterium]MCH8516312.1 DUF4139 domain-containing protein [Cyclobacteriaceae bacterium]